MANTLTVTSINLTRTFASIGVRLPFTNDDNANATATGRFRPVAGAWRDMLPMVQRRSGSIREFYGSVILLDADSEYEVEVTVADPDGTVGATVWSDTEFTRDIAAIAEPETLTPTRYVSATGSDSNDGMTIGTPWLTLQHAVSQVSAGAIVEIGPGRFKRPTSSLPAGTTWKARYPATDGIGAEINVGCHSVIEPAAVSVPGSTWVDTTIIGPGNGGAPAGASYRFWKWDNSPVSGAISLGYSSSASGRPIRVHHWDPFDGETSTVAGMAEKIRVNKSYNYGFFTDGTDIYVRMPGDLNPNDFYITAGPAGQNALTVSAADIRISGIEFVCWDRCIFLTNQNAVRTTIDHCYFVNSLFCVRIDGSKSLAVSAYGNDTYIWACRFEDRGMRAIPGETLPTGSIVPWVVVKAHIIDFDNVAYGSKMCANSENWCVGGQGGTQQCVIRKCAALGMFNGFGVASNSGFDRYASMDMDIYDNMLFDLADDPFEPESMSGSPGGPSGIINMHIWGNRVERALTFLSTGPAWFGPIIVARNVAWDIGRDGIAADGTGRTVEGTAFKYSGDSNPTCLIIVAHNTIVCGTVSTSGGSKAAGGASSYEHFYMRNNIIVGGGDYAFDAQSGGMWDEDYNYFASTAGLRYAGTIYTTGVAAYRAASGEGANTNVSGNFVTLPTFQNQAAGDLTLPVGSPLREAGVPVPNISDRAGIDYPGSAPSLGATE